MGSEMCIRDRPELNSENVKDKEAKVELSADDDDSDDDSDDALRISR